MNKKYLFLPLIATFAFASCAHGNTNGELGTNLGANMINNGIAPVISENQITYGLYPQTHVNDETLINTLNTLGPMSYDEDTGWYRFNNQYYARKIATPDGRNYKFNDGEAYWFKCEPIVWDILGTARGKYSVVSHNVLDTKDYYNKQYGKRKIDGENKHPTNYKYSEVRAWLNGKDGSTYGVKDYTLFINKSFVDVAFNLDSSYLCYTTVQNGPETTFSVDNEYTCENTYDRIYLLSYQEYLALGSDEARRSTTTDYARAAGAYSSTSENNGISLSRSPLWSDSSQVNVISDSGNLYFYEVNHEGLGVRPAATLRIS